MGNVTSHRFLEEDVNWNEYITSEWRSERSRELDRLGGLIRPALPLGQSFDRKLEWLGANVLEQASEITNLFHRKPQKQEDSRVEKRRVARKGAPLQEVAEWRFRVHVARRRVMLVVLVCVRLRVGLKRPTRLRRVDSFSYMIPLMLGDDSFRFIEAQMVTFSARDKAEAAQTRIADEVYLAKGVPPAASQEDKPGPAPALSQAHVHGQTQEQQAAGVAAQGTRSQQLAIGLQSPLRPAAKLSPNSAPPGTVGPLSPLPPASGPPSGPLSPTPGEAPRGLAGRRPMSPSVRIPQSPGARAGAPLPFHGQEPLSPGGTGPASGPLSGPASPELRSLATGQSQPSEPALSHKDSAQAPPSPDSTLAPRPSATASPDSLSPTDSATSSTTSKVASDAHSSQSPMGGAAVPGSGISSPCNRISEEGTERPSVDVDGGEGGGSGSKDKGGAGRSTEQVSTSAEHDTLPPLVTRPSAGKRGPGMLPLPGQRNRYVSECGANLASPQGRGPRSVPPARASEYGVAASPASMPGGTKVNLPYIPGLRPSKSSTDLQAAAGGDPGAEGALGAGAGAGGGGGGNGRASARARKEREKSARPGWSSLFRKAPQQPVAEKREARRSAPNLQLPSLPGASRPAARSARPSQNGRALAMLQPLGGMQPGVQPGGAVVTHMGMGMGMQVSHPQAGLLSGMQARQMLGMQPLQTIQQLQPLQAHQSLQPLQPLQPMQPLQPRPSNSRFMMVSVPSISRHAVHDPAAQQALERSRADPGAAMAEDVRRRLMARSFSAVEKEDAARSDMMLSMYINRVNTAWTTQQQWSPPSVIAASDPTMSDKAPILQDSHTNIMSQIRRGRVAFWFIVGEDSLPKANSAPGLPVAEGVVPHQDIWSSDPYDFITSCRPGLLHDMHDKVNRGYSYQSRALGSLALAVQEIGGRDALAKTHVVISMSDEQEELVTQGLWEHKFYGFNRDNVILIAQGKRQGYRYDMGTQRFIGVPLTAPESTGTGYAAMQLNWCPDAFTLNADGLVTGIHGTPAEVLTQRGVQWLTCYRARDLATMSGALDTKFLALGQGMLTTLGMNMVTQVLLSDNMGTARSLDSIVLKRNSTNNSELRMAELSAHVLDRAVEKAKSENNGMVAVGVQRYVFHVPSLKRNLVHSQDFRPKMRLRDGLLFLRYDISDLTSMEGANLAAVQVRETPTLLTSPKDLDQLLVATQQQDNDFRLMNYLNELLPKAVATQQQVVQVQQPPKEKQHLNTTVVFLDQVLSSLPAVRLAVALARPTKDAINLCTFVQDQSGVEGGKAMLMRVVERLGSTSILIRIDVVVRGAASLLDCMCQYTKAWHADMVVVTTRGLAKSDPTAILGSISLAIIKRMETPVLIVTPKSAQATLSMYDRKQVRLMTMVEGWSMPLLNFAVDRLITPRRGDHMLLGQVCSSRIATKQQLFNAKRYYNDAKRFVDEKHVERVQYVEMDGIFEQVVEKAVQDYRVNLVGIQPPPGSRALPRSLVSLLCTCTSAILVYKRDAASQSQSEDEESGKDKETGGEK